MIEMLLTSSAVWIFIFPALSSRPFSVITHPTMKHFHLLVAFGLSCLLQGAENPTQAPSDVKGPPADATKSPSGLASKVLRKGTGTEHPSAEDEVEVHYCGWTTDGESFDNSYDSGASVTFPLHGVIPGWTEGIQLMVTGEKRRFWIPAKLAYGDNPGGGRPGGMLVFDVELFSIRKPPAPPEHLTKAPGDALVSPTGLASRVLQPGKGSGRPSVKDTAFVNIVGWNSQGQLIMNTGPSAIRLPLEQAPVEGWSEAIQQMVKGEKRRVWVPETLAGASNPKIPSGLLIFDIELVDFQAPIPAPEAPADVAAAPAGAQKSASGLSSRIVKEGSGKASPKADSMVTVHYSGWTTDGKLFDSTITRGEPATFIVQQARLWSEGLQLMVKGEKRRFWIPEKYQPSESTDGRPPGVLVFDIELLEIQ